MLREGDDFAVKTRFAARQHCLQIFQVFQAGNRLNIAVAAGNGRAFRLDQVDQLFRALLGVGLQLRQHFLFQADHVLNRGTCRTVQRAPRAAVKGFIQVDVHVAHRREHQLAARVIVRQRGVGMDFIVAQGDDLPVVNLQRFQLGAGACRHAAVNVKPGFEQHVVEVVMFCGDAHRFAGLAGWLCGIRSIRDGAGGAKQRAGGDHFATLANKLAAAFVFTHLIFLH